jgi:hypothetical protein
MPITKLKNGQLPDTISSKTVDNTNDINTTTTRLKITGGSNGQVLSTDGSGNLSWATAGGGGLTNFAETYNLDTARIQPNGAAADIGIVISPKGNGAIQSAIRTDSSVGGGLRGNLAIDFQMVRNATNQVSAAERSTIISGRFGRIESGATDAGMYSAGNNSVINASGANSVIVGGTGQSIQNARSAIVGGQSNVVSGSNSAIISGSSNTVSAFNGGIFCGQSNTASGLWSAVLGGISNNANRNGAVAIGTGAHTNHSAYALAIGGNSTLGRAQAQYFALSVNTTSTGLFTLVNGDFENPLIYDGEAIGIKAVYVAKEYAGTTHYGMWELEALVTRFSGTTVIQWQNITTKVRSDVAMEPLFTINGQNLQFRFTGRALMQITASVHMTIVNRT